MLYLITGGVGFGLSLLSIILVAIFHAAGKKKLVPLILYVVGLALFLGSAFLSWKGVQIPFLSQFFDKNGEEVQQADDSASGGMEVDQGLLSVDVTVPAALFQGEDMENFDAGDYAQRNGFTKAVKNSDGSVTVTIPKSSYNKMLSDMADAYDNSFLLMQGAADTPYIKSITRSDNFSTIIIGVDREVYEEVQFDLSPFVTGMSGMMYQTFAGGDLHVEVVVKDDATGEMISSTVYPDALETQN